MNNQKAQAVTQVIILLIGLIAFAFIVGGMKTVSADGGGSDDECTSKGGTCSVLMQGNSNPSEGTYCNVNGNPGKVKHNLCFATKANYCCVPDKKETPTPPPPLPVETTACTAGIGFASSTVPSDSKFILGTCENSCSGRYIEGFGGICASEKVCCVLAPPITNPIGNDQLLGHSTDEITKKLEEKGGYSPEKAKEIATTLVTAGATAGITTFISRLFNKDVKEITTKETAKVLTEEAGLTLEEATTLAAEETPEAFAGFSSSLGLTGIYATMANMAGAAAVAYASWHGVVALSKALGAGYDGQLLLGTAASFGGALLGFYLMAATLGPIGWAVAIGAAFISAITGRVTVEKGTVIYTCNQWEPEVGGDNCDACNEQGPVPCSEYQCRSLGQDCVFEEDSETGQTICFEENSGDTEPPIIKPREESLPFDYKYVPDRNKYPDNQGIIIKKRTGTGCASPYESVSFGVKLDELAKCKVSFQRKNSFSEMDFKMGSTNLKSINHTQILKIPDLFSLGTSAEDNLISAYVRCQDAQGNSNLKSFVFDLCIDESPDTSPPIIEGVSPLDGSSVPFKTSKAKVEIYVDEPAECRWSINPHTIYDKMENNFTCDTTNIVQRNLKYSYHCVTNVTGIEREKESKFYFRCKDKPDAENETDRFSNTEDFVYSLSGSSPLEIIEASPNATTITNSVQGRTVTITAKTRGGINEGEAVCEYFPAGFPNDYTIFDNTPSFESTTELMNINSGDYSYDILCFDDAGNTDQVQINFTVDIDDTEPLIARAYYDEGYMKIITNEDSDCVYSTSSGGGCDYSFKDGISVSSIDKRIHLISWDTTSDLYVKCQDTYGNKPASPTACSIILRAQEYL